MTGRNDPTNPATVEYLEHLWDLDDLADCDCAADGLTVLVALCVVSAATTIGLTFWAVTRAIHLLKGL